MRNSFPENRELLAFWIIFLSIGSGDFQRIPFFRRVLAEIDFGLIVLGFPINAFFHEKIWTS